MALTPGLRLQPGSRNAKQTVSYGYRLLFAWDGRAALRPRRTADMPSFRYAAAFLWSFTK